MRFTLLSTAALFAGVMTLPTPEADPTSISHLSRRDHNEDIQAQERKAAPQDRSGASRKEMAFLMTNAEAEADAQCMLDHMEKNERPGGGLIAEDLGAAIQQWTADCDRKTRKLMAMNDAIARRQYEQSLPATGIANRRIFRHPDQDTSPGIDIETGIASNQVQPNRRTNPGTNLANNQVPPNRQTNSRTNVANNQVPPNRRINPGNTFANNRVAPNRRTNPGTNFANNQVQPNRRINPGTNFASNQVPPNQQTNPRLRTTNNQLPPVRQTNPLISTTRSRRVINNNNNDVATNPSVVDPRRRRVNNMVASGQGVP